MFSFKWKAVDDKGNLKSGELAAFSHKQAYNELRGYGYKTVTIVSQKIALFSLFSGKRVKQKYVIAFCRSLSTMITAGMMIQNAVEILAEQAEDKEFRKILKYVHQEVNGGASFARTIALYPKTFDNFFVSLTSAGESSGSLAGALKRIAEQLEKNDRLTKKVKSAMSYPLSVLAIAMILILVMLTMVIPTFSKMFGTMPLPLPTRILLALSTITQQFWPLLMVLIVGMVILWKFIIQTTKGKFFIDNTILHLPLIGGFMLKTAAARIARAMSLMIASGVLTIDALSIATTTVSNKALEARLITVTQHVIGGKNIADPLGKAGIFSPMAMGLISVGESTGRLAEMFDSVADFYDSEISTISESISTLIEPIMTVVIGLIVGGMLLAMYLPIFGMISIVGG
ncbi:MAG: type II secretion system F family protein [Deltaproteobacteria bacterium]